jgi:hypothetical protein
MRQASVERPDMLEAQTLTHEVFASLATIISNQSICLVL